MRIKDLLIKLPSVRVMVIFLIGVNIGILMAFLYLSDSNAAPGLEKNMLVEKYITLNINGTQKTVAVIATRNPSYIDYRKKKKKTNGSENKSTSVNLISTTINSPPSKTTVSVGFFKGRLGNHLFQYAAMFGAAKRLGMSMMIPSQGNVISKVFKGLRAKIGTLDKAQSNVFLNNIDCGFDDRLLKFDNKKDLILEGYLQSYKYFHQFKDELRKEFIFNDLYQNSAQSYLRSLKIPSSQAAPILIGVHIRKGDMASTFYFKYGYRTATIKYIYAAFDYFRQKYPNCIFVVCTDSKAWVRQNVKSTNMFISEGHTDLQDLAILSNCNHTIQTVGSFGYWAAYIAGGESIYYGKPVEPGSDVAKHYRIQDMYPPEWKSLTL